MPLDGTTLTAVWSANSDTEYKVEYYYQVDGQYSAQATSGVTRTGTTDTTGSVTEADKTPTLEGYVLDNAAGNIFSGNIA
jgi:hypothetical protein